MASSRWVPRPELAVGKQHGQAVKPRLVPVAALESWQVIGSWRETYEKADEVISDGYLGWRVLPTRTPDSAPHLTLSFRAPLGGGDRCGATGEGLAEVQVRALIGTAAGLASPIAAVGLVPGQVTAVGLGSPTAAVVTSHCPARTMHCEPRRQLARCPGPAIGPPGQIALPSAFRGHHRLGHTLRHRPR